MKTERYTNNGMSLKLLAQYRYYALFQRESDALFIVGVNTVFDGNRCEWGHGRYFTNEDDAREVYNNYVGGNPTAYLDWVERREKEDNSND